VICEQDKTAKVLCLGHPFDDTDVDDSPHFIPLPLKETVRLVQSNARLQVHVRYPRPRRQWRTRDRYGKTAVLDIPASVNVSQSTKSLHLYLHDVILSVKSGVSGKS
jgi:hypothetical protein